MQLKNLINTAIKTAIISGSMFIANSSFAQVPLKRILKKYDTDTMSYTVENVILLEQAFGVKKPKGFDKLYKKFIGKVPTKSDIDSATKNMGEIEKAEYIFQNIGDALSTVRSRYVIIKKFILSSTIIEGRLYNDCDAFSAFYASAFEKIYETKLDSTPFRFKRMKNHVFVEYKGENKSFTWETTTNDHQSKERYELVFNTKLDKLDESNIKSKKMWSTLFYTFSIDLYEKNKTESKKYFEKAIDIYGIKDPFFEKQYQIKFLEEKHN